MTMRLRLTPRAGPTHASWWQDSPSGQVVRSSFFGAPEAAQSLSAGRVVSANAFGAAVVSQPSGAHTLTAGGGVVFQGGGNGEAYAQFGNGGISALGNHSG
jgi:hypothetical protein